MRRQTHLYSYRCSFVDGAAVAIFVNKKLAHACNELLQVEREYFRCATGDSARQPEIGANIDDTPD